MKKSVCILICFLFLFSCGIFSKKTNAILSNKEEKALKSLQSMFEIVVNKNSVEARKCFANVCSIITYPKGVERQVIQDMISIYQVYFSSGFPEQEYLNQLSNNPIPQVLNKYKNLCINDRNFERCAFLLLANKNKAKCTFIRHDEGTKHIVKMKCEDWVKDKIK